MYKLLLASLMCFAPMSFIQSKDDSSELNRIIKDHAMCLRDLRNCSNGELLLLGKDLRGLEAEFHKEMERILKILGLLVAPGVGALACGMLINRPPVGELAASIGLGAVVGGVAKIALDLNGKDDESKFDAIRLLPIVRSEFERRKKGLSSEYVAEWEKLDGKYTERLRGIGNIFMNI